MKLLNVGFALYVIFVLSAASHAQTSKHGQAEITHLEQQLTDAANRGDASAVDKYLAPEYEVTSVTGVIANRDQALDSVRKRQQQNTISDLQVHVLGKAAVATYDSMVTATGGQDQRKIIENDFWVKHGKHWKLLASQGSPAQPLPAEMWSSARSQ
jgi:ketosteroid isomerase-like protein